MVRNNIYRDSWRYKSDSPPEDFAFRTYVVPDSTPPETTITSGPDALVNANSASIEFSSEDGATTECKLDAQEWESCSVNIVLNDLSEGQHTFQVRATDQAGHTDPTPAEITWTVDTKAPGGSVVINNGRERTKSRFVTLKLSAADPEPASGVTEMRFSNDCVTWSEWEAYAETKSWRLGRREGKKTVYVQYRDAAGNVSAPDSDSITYRR